MHFKSCLTALLATSTLTLALPQADKKAAGLRLIKTSPEDPGTWVTEEDKISKYTAKKINFIDVTDIKDSETLARLSSSPGTDAAGDNARLITYPAVSHQTEANTYISSLTTTGPRSWLKTLSDIFNRYYRSTTYGPQSSTSLLNLVRSITSANAAITVSQFTHSYNQPSIIARIPGASSNLIVVGAHFDSTGGSSTARGPGADDNGSGVVVIMEALRVLAAARFAPRNTLEFHFYSGEEGGLLGSADIWRSYKNSAKTVLAFVNTDMAGYSPSGKISVYNDYADTGLTAYVRRIVSAYIGSSTQDTCGYGCSDHASAYSNGFPAAYVCDEPDATSSPYIHSPQDTFATVDFNTVLRHAKFTTAFLIEANYL